MYFLFNCHGIAVARYKTNRGLLIGLAKRKTQLFKLYDDTFGPNYHYDRFVFRTKYINKVEVI